MLKLRKLWLDGWLSYDKAVFDLRPAGVTRVLGPIGAGKSAIFEAIFYLLYGKTIRKKPSLKDLANKVTKNGYTIQLSYSVGKDKYLVRESRGRPKKGLYFFKNKKEIKASDTRNLRKKIVETIGFSAEEFSAIAFRGQQQEHQLTQGTPEERAVAISSIFGLQKYDESIQRCFDDLKQAKEAHKELAGDLKKYREELAALEDRLLEEPDEQKLSENTVKNLEEKIVEKSDKLIKLNSKLAEVRSKISQYDEIERTKQRVKKIVEEITELKKELSNVGKPEGKKREIEKEIEELNSKKYKLESKIEEVIEKKEEARSLVNTCPVSEEPCPIKVPIKHRRKIIAQCEKFLKESRTKRVKIGNKLDRARKKKEKFEEYTSLKDRLEHKKEIMDSLKSSCKKVASITDLRTALKKYSGSAQTFSKALAELQEQRTQLKTKLAVRAEHQRMQKKIEDAFTEKAEVIDDLGKKVNRKHEEIQYLSAALAVFKKVKLYKIDIVIEELNRNINSILGKISKKEYRAEFVSQRKSADKKKTIDKLSIIVYDHHKEVPIELCSGGQSTEVGIAVLLSTWRTARTMSNKGVSSLWLDEVFGPLNPEIIDLVFESVVNIAEELGTTSVYIISHRDLDSRLFDHTWSINRENGISKVKIN